MTPPSPPQPEPRQNPFNGSIAAIVLIAIGAVLFLDNLGLVPFANIRDYWPLAISAWGLALLTRSRTACGIIWPLTMVAVGILVTLGNLQIVRANWGNIWPIYLIAAGAGMLLKRNDWPNWSRGHASHSFDLGEHFGPVERLRRKFSGNIIRENLVFSGVNRRIDTATFEGADLACVFGELKFDLRGATISTPNREAIVQTHAVFGAIRLRVPETWRIVVHGTAVFGAYEDKTVPPRPVPGIDPPTLIIRGDAAFGAVEIEN